MPQPNTTQAPYPNYLLAEDDTAFLKRPELRPVRLQLELLKPEILLEEHRVASTLVVFGGTQIVELQIAAERLAAARAARDPPTNQTQKKTAHTPRHPAI
jgi:hypothetical protein